MNGVDALNLDAAKATIPPGWLPDTSEEHRQVGDLADVMMFQAMTLEIAAKVRSRAYREEDKADGEP